LILFFFVFCSILQVSFKMAFEEGDEELKTFEDLGVIPELCLACTKLGYTTPSPIQAQAIPAALAGNDIIGLAQTGRYFIFFNPQRQNGSIRTPNPPSPLEIPHDLAIRVRHGTGTM
jgi:hypothetical protein